jgi:predicted metal-dependent phosphoesterase TrpH
MSAGHTATIGEAFERWIGTGRPAFVPRMGARPGEVVRQIHEAGGLASLAHPALSGPDGEADKAAWIEGLVSEGLDAIEAFHSKHDADATGRYLSLAARLGIEVSGGSDFHGDVQHGPAAPGAVSLPQEHFDRLKSRWQSGQN